MTTPETATFAAFARILGCKPSAVTALRHAGRLVLTDDGKRVQVQSSLERIRETADPSKEPVAARHAAARGASLATAIEPPVDAGAMADDDDADTTGFSYDYQRARARREHYQAQEAQRAYEVAIGKLMVADDVASAVASATTTLRVRLESLPDVLAPQLAAINDENQVRAMLLDAVEHALTETARQFARLVAEPAA